MLGKRFGTRRAVAPAPPGTGGGKRLWMLCDCGSLKSISRDAIRSGRSRTCLACARSSNSPFFVSRARKHARDRLLNMWASWKLLYTTQELSVAPPDPCTYSRAEALSLVGANPTLARWT